jgi:C4-dicarboxylate transporter DctQ subunit
MPNFYLSIRHAFSRLNLACAALGAAILFFVAAIIVWEVISRALFGHSRLWVIEVSEYSLLFITFLGAPYLLEKNMHVVLDIVYDNLGPGMRRVATVINASLGLAICVLLTVVGISVVLDQYAVGVRQTTVMAPHSYWITASLPLGMFLMGMQFIDKGLSSILDEDH